MIAESWFLMILAVYRIEKKNWTKKLQLRHVAHFCYFVSAEFSIEKVCFVQLNIFLDRWRDVNVLLVCFIDLTNRQRLWTNKFSIFCSRILVLGRNTLKTYLFRKRRPSPRASKKEERFLRRNIVRYKRGNARYLFYKKILLHAPWEERYDFLAPPA